MAGDAPISYRQLQLRAITSSVLFDDFLGVEAGISKKQKGILKYNESLRRI